MRTMRWSYKLLVLSASFVSSTAYAQTAPSAREPARAAAPEPPAKPVHSWFWRPPLAFSVGEGDQKWTAQILGFAELDMITDSTRSFLESIGQGSVARNTNRNAMTGAITPNQAGQNGRTQFSARNSRLGVRVIAPTIDGIKPSALVEMDFMGNQPAATANATANSTGGAISEASLYTSATFKLRHAYLKLENDIVNVLAGQAYDIFGGPDLTFFPSTSEFLAIPNMVIARTPQLRLWKSLKTDIVDVDLTVGAMRPPQRDSTIPEGQGALVFKINHWQGIGTPGAGGTGAFPLAIGVSGTVRAFRVDQLNAANGPGKDTGWGVSVDGFLPVIPAEDSNDRGNKLTVTGSFTTGSGYGDLFGGLSGGFNGLNINAAPLAPAAGMPLTIPVPISLQGDSDTGMVAYDAGGVLHTVNWTTFKAGLQYYLPGGRFFVTGNVSHGQSNNIVSIVTNGVGNTAPAARNVWKESLYWDASVFADITANARLGMTFSRLQQTYGDDGSSDTSDSIATNNRFRACLYFFF